jgi:hypothetical protein
MYSVKAQTHRFAGVRRAQATKRQFKRWQVNLTLFRANGEREKHFD